MGQEETFDLGSFLPDTLCLHSTTTPLRNSFPCKPRDRYEEIKRQKPLDILGETKFGEPIVVSKDTIGTPIQEFFRGKSILITGATGFVGKILIDKLIRSIPHLEQVYLVIRSKRGKSAQERLDHLMEDKVFCRLKTEVPWWCDRVTAVAGDLSEPGLGLSQSDCRMLCDRVHVVFHSAADVKFTEPLRVAVTANVLGSQTVLRLAKQMKQLQAYVHVSTAFSNCVEREVREIVPTMSIGYEEILELINNKSDQELEDQTIRLLQGWPNTYTFTKALAERMVEEEGKGLPYCIVRPSIIMPTYIDPVRGYSDNLYGPVGLLLGAGHGILHCAHVANELNVDVVPVDYTANCLIAAAFHTATQRGANPVTVYNYTSTAWNYLINWKQLIKFALDNKRIWPMGRAIWYTSFFYTNNYLVNEVCSYLLHVLPGYVIDKIAQLKGEKFRLSRVYQTIDTMKHQARYFSGRIWIFHGDNTAALWRGLSPDDQKLFHFDPRDIDSREMFLVSKIGLRYYYLKESMEGIPAAERKNNRLFWIHNTIKVAFGLATLKLLVVLAHIVPL